MQKNTFLLKEICYNDYESETTMTKKEECEEKCPKYMFLMQ